jgi:exosortase D (VPLPA-CTERM-specific)
VPFRNLLTLLLLITWLYAATLFRLFMQLAGPHSDPYFQHGILVPLFALFVLWQDRTRLAAITPEPSWAGLPLVVFSALLLLLGDLGADIFLPRVSFLILLAGMIILFQGWSFFRAVLFPWAFLILMIPIPALLINRVTFPLQLLAARLATVLFGLLGFAVLREGNIITLGSGRMDVAEACSGLRSLLSLITLAVIYGYLMEARNWVRVALVCLAVPIAVAANSFRILGTGLLRQSGHREAAEGVPHTIEGLLVFAAALIMLFAAHRLLSLVWKSAPVAPREVAHLQEQSAARICMNIESSRLGIVALPMLAAAIFLQVHSRGDVKHVGTMPYQIGDWKGTDVPISQEELDILGPGEYMQREYENAGQSQPGINLFIPFFPSQRAGDTIHSPEHCLTGAGWFPISREVIPLRLADGTFIHVNRYVVSKAGQRQLVLYWFQAHGRVVASEWRAKYYLISDSIHMNRSDGGMVRVMTLMLSGESPEAAQARIMKLGSELLPLLDSYIPRGDLGHFLVVVNRRQ